VLGRKAYLNAGTFGPLPRRAAEIMAERGRRDLEQGRSSRAYFEETLALRERLRAALSELLGAPPGSVALTTSTSDGCAIALLALGLGPDDEIVTTDAEHPGLEGPIHASGARIRVAAVESLPVEDAVAAIEAQISPRTRLVALSHVLWTTGAILPVERLRRRGIPLLVDGAQGAGAIPVDVTSLGCDFYTVSAQKWLLGPEATGALYVRPEIVDSLRLAAPSYYSWQRGTYEPQPGAARFDTGWIPTGAVEGLLAALDFACELGPARFDAAGAQAARCRELLAERVDVVTEPGQGTLVAFRPRCDAAELVETLARRDVVIRDLPGRGWARASLGFWTSDEDLERLVEGL
jgi:L-cysteine/cystine lyase